jgi:hypothetical protein
VRCKDAGSLDSGAIEATEDAAGCVPSAFRRPVLTLLELLRAAEDAPEADGERHQEHGDDDSADDAAGRVSHDQVRHSESEEEQRAKQAET